MRRAWRADQAIPFELITGFPQPQSASRVAFFLACAHEAAYGEVGEQDAKGGEDPEVMGGGRPGWEVEVAAQSPGGGEHGAGQQGEEGPGNTEPKCAGVGSQRLPEGAFQAAAGLATWLAAGAMTCCRIGMGLKYRDFPGARAAAGFGRLRRGFRRGGSRR